MWMNVGFRFSFALTLLALAGSVGAQSADDLAKQAKTELRQATGKMFNGKNAEAMEQLVVVEDLVKKIEALDSSHKDLASLKQKSAKLRKDIERKLPKEPQEKPDTPAEKPPAQPAGDVKLPSPVKSAMAKADRAHGDIGDRIAKVEATNDPEEAARQLKNAAGKADYYERNVATAAEEAGKRGFGDLPWFAEAAEKLAAARARIAELEAKVAALEGAAAESAAGADADFAAIDAEFKRLRESTFDKATGTAAYYNDLPPAQELLEVIQNFERKDLEKTQKHMAEFAAKYGTTRDEINDAMYGAGFTGGVQPCGPYLQLVEGIEGVAKTRPAMAENLIDRAQQRLDNVAGLNGFYLVEHLLETKEWVLLAGQFDAENPKVQEALANIDPQVKQHIAAFNEQIDKIKLPPHAENAPSNAKELAAIVLEWVAKSPDWGKRKMAPRRALAVVVTGPWSVQEKNVMGDPLNYGLPVRIVVQLDSEKEADLARWYDLTMRTFTSRNPKMEPPFEYPTVGSSGYMRASNAKR